MGVSSILFWDPPEGMNAAQGLDLLQRKVDILGGKSLGPWTVDCETLQSTQTLTAGGPQKLVHMLHSSEFPRTTFAVLDSMNCIVADNSLDAIFMNLRQFYTPNTKKGQKIEVKGYHFAVESYLVKFGSIVLGSSNKGIVVEVEDQDSTTVAKCWEKLSRFVQGFLEDSSPITPPSHSVHTRPYTPSDAMIHYAYIFTHMRKPPASAMGVAKPGAAAPIATVTSTMTS